MSERLRLLCVLAHPDDESLGTGGILARYASEGVETYLVTATRGEAGWQGDEQDNPGPVVLGQLRETELHAAAGVLGVREVELLSYADGMLAQADPAEVIATIVGTLRRVRPQVVVTFGPDGITGHPDHIAISQFTTAAIVGAADASYPAAWDWPPHRVTKLYYLADSQKMLTTYASVFGELALQVDGVKRAFPGWLDWAITTRIDTRAHWPQVWQAVSCHRSQLPNYETLEQLPATKHEALWGCQELYRVFSLVNGGREVERDLFAGLR